jgi:hypothetical protein
MYKTEIWRYIEITFVSINHKNQKKTKNIIFNIFRRSSLFSSFILGCLVSSHVLLGEKRTDHAKI